ncbi:hypothetical protein [Actinacidiphila glaucinigra]|uniref:hypothetical protein n=1 Tax=Actinacidiphila glaucinigra TaxID=235986 RepID=UPI0035DB9739
MTTVTFQDETAGGKPLTALEVSGLPDRMTARDLLHLRVREEVTRHNADPANTPLDRPTEAARAERAFLSNAFFVLTPTHQVTELDDVIDLTTTPSLTFLRLVPLAGG